MTGEPTQHGGEAKEPLESDEDLNSRPGDLSKPIDPSEFFTRQDGPQRKAANIERQRYAAVFTSGIAAAAAAGVTLGLRQRIVRRRNGAMNDP